MQIPFDVEDTQNHFATSNVDLFKEILTVDIPKEDQAMVAEYDEEKVAEEEEEAGVYVASPASDGVAKEDLESLEYKSDRLEMKNEGLTKENKDLKNLLINHAF